MITTENITLEQAKLCQSLKSMHLASMSEVLRQQFANPNSDLRSFEDRIQEIINAECDSRYNRKLTRFVKKADLKFPYASFDEKLNLPERKIDVQMLEQLQLCTWIGEGKNLLITGATGTGKTYVSNALAMCALQRFKTVRYFRAEKFIQKYDKEKVLNTELDFENEMADLDLLIIDDFGLMELDVRKTRSLLNVIEARDTRKSTIIISQFPVDKWYRFFKNSTYADSLMDRILSKAYKLEFSGPSLRN